MRCSDSYKPADFTLLKWSLIDPDERGYIYWHIVNHTSDQPKEDTIAAFRKAFYVWQMAFDNIPPVGRVITLEPTNDFHKAHVRLFFMEPNTRHQEYVISDGSTYTLENRWPFSGPGEVLAHRPPNKHEVHFDESEDWSKLSLRGTAVHELGNAIADLGHSKAKGSVMAEYYQGDVIKLAQDDQDGINASYGSIKKKLARRINITPGLAPDLSKNKGCLSILGL